VLDQFPETVNYVIKQYPLPNHAFAHESAMAVLAAGRQGKFWEFHSQLLEHHSELDEAKINEIAVALGVDMDRFSQDRQLEASRQMIREDIEEGKALGVNGTPSVFMNGKRINNKDLGSLPQLIARELEKR
jgi:protein-disulfide isomerase